MRLSCEFCDLTALDDHECWAIIDEIAVCTNCNDKLEIVE